MKGVFLFAWVTVALAAPQDNQKRTACASLPVGYGPLPTPDTASSFESYGAFASAASAAAVPDGYTQEYVNLNRSSDAHGYLGYSTLETYDVDACAAKCDAISNCMSINVYFERDPLLDPGSGNTSCANPTSTTTIKCALWGGPVSINNAVNSGQMRNQFQVVVAGSNGYTKSGSFYLQASGGSYVDGQYALLSGEDNETIMTFSSDIAQAANFTIQSGHLLNDGFLANSDTTTLATVYFDSPGEFPGSPVISCALSQGTQGVLTCSQGGAPDANVFQFCPGNCATGVEPCAGVSLGNSLDSRCQPLTLSAVRSS